MKRKLLSTLLIALSLISSAVFAEEEKPLDAFIRHVGESYTFASVNNLWQPNNLFDKTELLKDVERVQPLLIDYSRIASFMQNKATAIELEIPGLDGGTYTLQVARYDFLSNDFEVHGVSDKGDTKMEYTPGLYYRGIVKGIPGSLVAFSFFNNEVWGTFSIPGEGNYVLAPNTLSGNATNNLNYILYNDNDITFKDLAPKCLTDDLPDTRPAHKTTTTANNNVYNNCTEVRCFETVDYTMYTKKGSNVTTLTNYVTAMFNAKATIYKNEGVPIVLKYLQINTTTDNYASLPTTSSIIWLDTFGKRTQNVLHGCDVATLFTTKGGTMGGVAWLDAMCQSYSASSFFGPYAFCNLNNSTSTTVSAFPTYSWEVEVATHEMGHNLGSPHTHACAWGPARNYAIDSCYTIEGSCIAPAGRPSGTVKGTIMSYCHLISSIGISFNNGFGQQPGDTVRYFLAHTFSSSCGVAYHPGYALSRSNRTITANRECTDMNTGYTYYWNDNLTANNGDDTLVLIVKKNGNNIGNLNTSGFSVKNGTLSAWGTGAGQATTFPSGTTGTGTSNFSMNRYWTMVGAGRPTSNVEVIYPFTVKDSADVDGSITGAPIALTSLRMYKVDSGIDANPANSFPGATSSKIKTYTYGTTASTTNWSLTRSADTCFAHFLTSNVSGGGTGFYAVGPVVAIANAMGGNVDIHIYPNPTNGSWYIGINGSNDPEMTIEIYAADGKLVHSQTLVTSNTNVIDGSGFSTGMYYYRMISNSGTCTGSLMKQ